MYENIFQAMNQVLNNPAVAQQYLSNPQQCIAQFNLSEEEQNYLFSFLSPVDQIRKMQEDAYTTMMAQQKKTQSVNNSFSDSIMHANEQTTRGFFSTMIMYQVSFYLGIALIITAVVFAIVARSPLFSIIFGSIGTIDLLTFFIAKPPQDLQKSRSEQAKLNAVFYSWFLDLYNWNSFFVQFSSKGEKVDLATIKEVSKAQIENTERLMKIISEHIASVSDKE